MKAASRFLLPLEIYLGLTMFAWGLSGGLGRGYLFKLLQSIGDNEAWFWTLCAIGGAQMGMAMLEWVAGKRWPLWTTQAWPPSVHVSSSLRASLAFVAGMVWLYVLKLVVSVPGMAHITVLAIMAPVSLLFCCWVFVENLKVRYALDPRIPTSTMRFDR